MNDESFIPLSCILFNCLNLFAILLYFSGMFFSLNKQASNQTISSEFIEVPTVTLI